MRTIIGQYGIIVLTALILTALFLMSRTMTVDGVTGIGNIIGVNASVDDVTMDTSVDSSTTILSANQIKPSITYSPESTGFETDTSIDLTTQFTALDADGNGLDAQITSVIRINPLTGLEEEYLFTIEASTGIKTVLQETDSFIFPYSGSYIITVTSTDTNGYTTTLSFTIPVNRKAA